MTLDEYTQKYGDELLDDLYDEIDDLGIPQDIASKIKTIVQDEEFDVLEHNYKVLESANEDRLYDEWKERDI